MIRKLEIVIKKTTHNKIQILYIKRRNIKRKKEKENYIPPRGCCLIIYEYGKKQNKKSGKREKIK